TLPIADFGLKTADFWIADCRLRLPIVDGDCRLRILPPRLDLASVDSAAIGGVLSRLHSDRALEAGTPSAFHPVMNSKALALQARTRAFADRVIKLCEELPSTPAADSIREQLIASSGSADSNYRAACRARSRKEFISKLGVVVEESDESLGWLQLLIDSSICATDGAKSLVDEANQLVAIFVQSEKTAKRNYEAELARRQAALHRKSRPR